MPQIATSSAEAVVTLNPCQVPPPDPVVTTAAPVREHQSLYVVTGDCLYTVDAADGTTRWCQQVQLIMTRKVRYQPKMSYPPPRRMAFGTPRVVGPSGVSGVSGVTGMVYVCLYGFGGYTCAFAADDGALRWWTPTDARVLNMPFLDFAVPLVQDGIVYSGSYALNAQDGAVLWRIAINPPEEGTLALHALTDETLYATTHMGIYALSAHDGQIRWRYHPKQQTMVSGPPVVSGRLFYAGTSGGVGSAEQSYVCALDVETGTEVWRSPHPMGRYGGAVVQHETLYVSSDGGLLSALDTKSGRLRWQHQFAAQQQYSAASATGVLYLNTDGAYALSSADGMVLWHQPLEKSPGVSFGPPIVLDGALYLVRTVDLGQSVVYALDARTGAECWHTPYPFAHAVGVTVAVGR